MKVVIIEDEFAALNNLKELLYAMDNMIEVVAELDSISDSINWFSKVSTSGLDLIFMDIHLSDGAAFQIFKHISIPTPIIFTTAYDEYALQAFQVNSIDYLLKPIDETQLLRAIQKYKNLSVSLHLSNIQAFINNIYSDEKRYKSHLLIPFKDELIPVAVHDIAYLYIENSIVKLRTFTGKTLFVSGKLDDFTEILSPRHFFRLNRQFFAAKSAIKSMNQYFNGRLMIHLNPPAAEQVLVSKERTATFKEWFTA